MNSPDIYRNEKARSLQDAFLNPGPILRGTPFWSWNTRLKRDQILRQIEMFKIMGFGGFHIHSRTGLATPYLGPDFMEAVRAGVEKARDEGLFAWLYDEDRWPSGFAGGLVTKEEKYRARYLVFTPFPDVGESGLEASKCASTATRTQPGKLLARYSVTLENGRLARYGRLGEDDIDSSDDGETWYACLHVAQPDPWFNNQTYADTLSVEAVTKFLECTHEVYAKEVGGLFGTIVPAIFTDEPHTTWKTVLDLADHKMDVAIPWTDDLPATCQAACGVDLLDSLPELFWELPDRRVSPTRYRYHDHVTERFASAFADTIGRWCEKHSIALTGHMLEEPTLFSQTRAVGEAMRHYRSFQIPGIDMLCDDREYTTAKQAQSAAHQYGRCGVLSELYGVTDWDFDFRGHKSQGDWQAALGVTVRVHHLAWMTMEGEAKRDYPASIFYQSPWWKEYPIVEDHFARLNAALTRGKPRVRIGLIHPIESFWLCFGPMDQTNLERSEREYTFKQITEWLLFGQLDFDYIAESLLPDLCPVQDGGSFRAGEMLYDAIVVPPMRTIRSTTLDRLESFAAAGGQIVFAGEVPELVDAVPSDRAKLLAERAGSIPFTQATLLRELQEVREIEVGKSNGELYSEVLHQIRDDGERRYVFICDTRRDGDPMQCKVGIRGLWKAMLLDTFTGVIRPLPGDSDNGWTSLDWTFYPHGHLLIMLSPGTPERSEQCEAVKPLSGKELESKTIALLDDPVPVTLSEPNALVLDQAEWRLDDGEWQPIEEILRLNNIVRNRLGLPAQSGFIAQPWTETEQPRLCGKLEIRYRIECGIDIKSSKVALEQADSTLILVDGNKLDASVDGWWVDEAIQTVPLPGLSAGVHELVFSLDYKSNTSLECAYLLGDFGVDVRGRHARIVPPVRELAWGDWTHQGLPFYTGNVTYHCRFKSHATKTKARAPHFRGAMVGVTIDKVKSPGIAFAPYESELGKLERGTHSLDLTLFGNRFNAFGILHAAVRPPWVGPSSWRTSGDKWGYEYNLRPAGILSAPRITECE